MRIEQARRLKELEKENSRLKKLVADVSLDNVLLLDPSLHDAGLVNPGNCSGSWGDSGMATTLPHGRGGPKVNRPTTLSL